jgi:predicted Fe-Mo cluster-binding NifX family protein
MKAGIASWNGRISPVFDASGELVVVETRAGRIVGRSCHELPADPAAKVRRLAELGIDTLICGAISLPLSSMAEGFSLGVIPFVAGDLEVVIRAWMSGRLRTGAFAMPGCRGSAGRIRGARRGRCRAAGKGRGATGVPRHRPETAKGG